MDYAFLQNQAGNFVEPSLESTGAAVAAATNNNTQTSNNSTTSTNLPAGDASWETVSLLDASGADSYPIASFSYLLLYKELSDNPRIDSMEKARALVDFINWAITDGQQFAGELAYVPLPDSVVQHNQETLRSLTFQGEPVLQ
jgi:phosphate transport system permease protein/phosphate transport system substrate-binding protein